MVTAGEHLSSSRPGRRATTRPAERIPVWVEPRPPFAETPGPGKDWWEKVLSEKSFRAGKRRKIQQNQEVGAKSRTTTFGPFGEVIRATGPMAKINPFRFSTKYTDDETDFLYYGFRYYNQSTGRWLSRDPVGEDGGMNLYDFAVNDPIQRVDPLGFTTGTITITPNDSTPIRELGRAGWHFRARWTPPAEWTCCEKCKKAVWVQDKSWVMKKRLFLPIYVSQEWTKDWDETDYNKPPHNNSDLWDCKQFPRGNRSDYMDMWDDPDVSGRTWLILITMDFYAESRVKCIEGNDAGKIYGHVLWGYHYKMGWGWPWDQVTGGVIRIW